MDKIKTILDVEAFNVTEPDVEKIRSAWTDFANDPRFPGFALRPTPRPRMFQESGLTAEAYVSESRWVANCPTTYCNGGIMCLPGHPEAACFDCGMIHKVTFPKQVLQIEAYLLPRPYMNRHWFPHETVKDLRDQNAEHEIRLP